MRGHFHCFEAPKPSFTMEMAAEGKSLKPRPAAKCPLAAQRPSQRRILQVGLSGSSRRLRRQSSKRSLRYGNKRHIKCGLRDRLFEKIGLKNRFTFELILKKINSLFYVPTVDSVAFKTVRSSYHHHHQLKIK